MKNHLQTVSTEYGTFTIDTEADKKISAGLLSGRHHQEDTLRLLQACVDETSIVVDIGAHIGTLAVPLARRVKKVIAFEPAPATFELLLKNAEQNAVTLDARNMGLGQSKGHATLVSRVTGNAGAQTLAVGSGPLALSTLDDEVQAADLVKIDTEGMDFDILKGGTKLLSHARPLVYLEVDPSQLRAHGGSTVTLDALLHTHKYRFFLPRYISGEIRLGAINNLTLFSACITPRWFLFGGKSAFFDILAIPIEKQPPFPVISALSTLRYVIAENWRIRLHRIRTALHF